MSSSFASALDILRPASFNAIPPLAGYLAFRAFCTPRMSRHRSPDHDALVERARFHLRAVPSRLIPTSAGEVRTYFAEPESEPRASVMVVHGWTSEASFMMAIAEFLRRRGYRVVLPDLPAHGQSPGERTSLIACAHALREVAEAVARVEFVVAHSMGGLAALLVGGGGRPLPRAFPFKAFALLGVPNRFEDVTRRFAREQVISDSARKAFERRLERLAQRLITDFTGANLLAAARRPALLIHSRDDAEVPFAEGEAIAAACPLARLEAVDGLGHRKILYAPPVARIIGAFLDAQLQAAPNRNWS